MDEPQPARWESPITLQVAASVIFDQPDPDADPSLEMFLRRDDNGGWTIDLSGVGHGSRPALFEQFDAWRAPWARVTLVGGLDELADLSAAGRVAVPDVTVFEPGVLHALREGRPVELTGSDLVGLVEHLGKVRDAFDAAGMRGVGFEPLGAGRPRSVWVDAGEQTLVRSPSMWVTADDRARCWVHLDGRRHRILGWRREPGHTVAVGVDDDIIIDDPDALLLEWMAPRADEVSIIARPLTQLWRHLIDPLMSLSAFAAPRGVALTLEPR